jgi:uncharacterized protein
MRAPVWLTALAAAVAAGPALGQAPPAPPADRCHVGVYRLSDGALVDVAPTSDGALRWRTMDGRTGRLVHAADGGWTGTRGWGPSADDVAVSFGACADGRIAFDGKAGSRQDLEVRDTTFAGAGGTLLAGRLVLPRGGKAVPVSVLVHGSEDYSGREYYFEPRAWPAQGVGVFVYDKRGTGGSQGKYTQDFHVLSDDAAAAAREARRLGGRRVARLGFDGGSQAGWIIPLAATKVEVDYAVIRYGMAESPLAEDRGETLRGLKDKGYGPEVLAKAAQVTDATAKVVLSRFTDFSDLNALRAKWGGEPWWNDLDGEFTGQIAKAPEAAVRVIGPQQDKGATWEHDPMPVLRRLKTPILWLIAGDDLEAPPEETARRLVGLAREGRRITVLEFPKTDHGLREFDVVNGKRVYTRYADGYYRAVLDFTKTGKAAGNYGAASRLTP